MTCWLECYAFFRCFLFSTSLQLHCPPCIAFFSQVAFDKLTVDSAHQQASAAVAAATAADQQAGFDIRMAKAAHDAGGMKAGFTADTCSVNFPLLQSTDCALPLLPPFLRLPLISSQ